MARRYDELEREAKSIAELFLDAPYVSFFSGMAAWQQGRREQALRLLDEASTGFERAPYVVAFHAAACYGLGEPARGDALFDELRERSRTEYLSSGVLALVHVARGEAIDAIRLLRQERAQGENFFAQFRAAVDLLPVRQDPMLFPELEELGFR